MPRLHLQDHDPATHDVFHQCLSSATVKNPWKNLLRMPRESDTVGPCSTSVSSFSTLQNTRTSWDSCGDPPSFTVDHSARLRSSTMAFSRHLLAKVQNSTKTKRERAFLQSSSWDDHRLKTGMLRKGIAPPSTGAFVMLRPACAAQSMRCLNTRPSSKL